MIKKILIKAAIIFISSPVFAATSSNFDASVTINESEPLSLNQRRSMSFGVIEKPAQGEIVKVSISIQQNGIAGANTTANVVNASSITQGLFEIDGDRNKTISMNFEGDNSIPGLTISDFKIRYLGLVLGSSPSGIRMPRENEDNRLGVTATLTIDGSKIQGAGEFTPSYSVQVDYE